MTPKELQDLVKRRHPHYADKLEHWNFLDATYEGGRAWFVDNIFQYHKEGDGEFKDRVKRAYRFNHTKQVVDLVDKYLFKQKPARKVEDAPESVQRFWKDATLSGMDIDTLSKRYSSSGSKFGRVYVVVDSTARQGETPVSKADEKSGDARVYSYIVNPQDMLDMSYDEQGVYNWVLIREMHRDDADPISSKGGFRPRYRLWMRDKWFLFEDQGKDGKVKIVQIETGENAIGRVPVEEVDHTITEEQYSASGLIDDVAYLDRANANYLSNLDAIIQDQTFSQLTIPAQSILPGEDGYEKAIEASTKRTFTYNGEGGKPEFISPDPRQAGMILQTIGEIVGEIYHSVGLRADRTGGNSGGGQSGEASGVSKAYDFEKINSLLAAKAASLQHAEIRIARLVARYAGEEDKVTDDLIKYPEDFDVRGLLDEFEIAARLNLIAAPDEVRREQMRALITKLFPSASKALVTKLEASLKDWPPQIEPGLGADKAPGSGTKSNPVKAAGNQKTAKELAAA